MDLVEEWSLASPGGARKKEKIFRSLPLLAEVSLESISRSKSQSAEKQNAQEWENRKLKFFFSPFLLRLIEPIAG
jgi:hypothetical protein